MRRMLRALVARATDGDLFALESLANLERAIPEAVEAAARGAHAGEAGYSWGEIGRELGISRQAAHQRFAVREGGNGEGLPGLE